MGDCSPGFRASLGISEERCGGLEGSTEGAVGRGVEGGRGEAVSRGNIHSRSVAEER